MNNEKKGYRIKSNVFVNVCDKDSFETKSSQWMVMYALSNENIERFVRNCCYYELSYIYTKPHECKNITPEEFRNLCENESNNEVTDDSQFNEEAEELAQEAMNYLRQNFTGMFDSTLSAFVQEAVIKAFIIRGGEGTYDLKGTHLQAFDNLFQDCVQVIRDRAQIGKQSGRPSIWNQQNLARLKKQFGDLYSKVLKVCDDYKKFKDFKDVKKIVMSMNEGFPDEIYEKILLGGKDAEPLRLVAAYLSSKFGNRSEDNIISEWNKLKRIPEKQSKNYSKRKQN